MEWFFGFCVGISVAVLACQLSANRKHREWCEIVDRLASTLEKMEKKDGPQKHLDSLKLAKVTHGL